MRERRVVGLTRCQGDALSLALATNPAGAAELYGLVVGVDDYVGTANDLDGAVNDANDVAQALHRLGAREVIRLVNGDATKDRVAASWQDLLGKAKGGDNIVFSYEGHGSQEPEPAGRHDEADQREFPAGRLSIARTRHARAPPRRSSSASRIREPRR